ncbi:hypothetical protein Golob_012762 [Gossypium lobatum]|uniref:Reverse transcriptase n=1 Tax=Gossypium lobatum TaxID=34289 RepID=A0A7J8LMP8_9ROSI|nr:hypothetical protein [Gossypium lobatum]
MDIGYSGAWFTWEMGNLPKTIVRESLDRGVAIAEWLMRSFNIFLILSRIIALFSFELIRDLKKGLVDWAGSIKLTRKALKTELTRELKEFMGADRHKNCIRSLQYEDGRETSDEGEMEEIVGGYFQKLFTSSGVGDMSHILLGIDNFISQDVNSKLTTTYLVDEVITTLKEIGPTKAFRDDGFLALFSQKYWHIVGRDVIYFYLNVLNEGMDFDEMLVRMEFDARWIKTIMKCISTVSYSVVVNGKIGILGVRHSNDPKRYLGLPNMIRKRKKASFQILKDRFKQRIESWSVIPTYSMVCFLLPKTLCNELDIIMAKFWPQKGFCKKGTHWCTWDHLNEPKEIGGFSFRSLAKFNVALLAKEGWHLNDEDWFTWIFRMSSSDQCKLFCCAIWRIWTHKNLVLHKGSQIKGKEITDWITRYIGEIDNLEDKKFTRYVNEEWCLPLGSDVKVNFDVAYNQSLARSGSLVVVCKSRGEILVSKHTLQKEIVSPFQRKDTSAFRRCFWETIWAFHQLP